MPTKRSRTQELMSQHSEIISQYRAKREELNQKIASMRELISGKKVSNRTARIRRLRKTIETLHDEVTTVGTELSGVWDRLHENKDQSRKVNAKEFEEMMDDSGDEITYEFALSAYEHWDKSKTNHAKDGASHVRADYQREEDEMLIE